jgi:hypothetical protein
MFYYPATHRMERLESPGFPPGQGLHFVSSEPGSGAVAMHNLPIDPSNDREQYLVVGGPNNNLVGQWKGPSPDVGIFDQWFVCSDNKVNAHIMVTKVMVALFHATIRSEVLWCGFVVLSNLNGIKNRL